MAWTEPKTNWTKYDCYTVEEAQKFADNLKVVKDLAAQVYPSDPMYFLTNRQAVSFWGNTLCYMYDISPASIVIKDPSETDDAGIFFAYNLEALWKICLMGWGWEQGQTGPTYPIKYYDGTEAVKRYVDWYIEGSDPAQYLYTGYALVEPDDYRYSYDPFYYMKNYGDLFIGLGVRMPFNARVYNAAGKAYAAVDSRYILGNEPFYTVNELNWMNELLRYRYLWLNDLIGGNE